MESKRFGNKIIVRIDKDEEILEQVKTFVFHGEASPLCGFYALLFAGNERRFIIF